VGRGTKKVENHCSMQICCLKKTFIWYELHVKKYLNAELHRTARALTDEPELSAGERSREIACYYER